MTPLRITVPSKYRNKRTEYKDVLYDSAKEAKFAAECDLLVRAGQLKKWDRQVRRPLIVNNTVVTTIVIDFRLVWHGKVEYVEVKGYPTPEWELKWKLFKALNPKVQTRVI